MTSRGDARLFCGMAKSRGADRNPQLPQRIVKTRDFQHFTRDNVTGNLCAWFPKRETFKPGGFTQKRFFFTLCWYFLSPFCWSFFSSFVSQRLLRMPQGLHL